MYYKNIVSRFILRKNLWARIRMRLSNEKRKLTKNEFDDLAFLYAVLDKKPNIIFDCGANVGFVSYQFYKKFSESKIYAFEPNPSVYEKLVLNLLKEKEAVQPFNLGIDSETGNLEFFKNNNTGTSSFLEPNDFHMSHMARNYQKVEVPVISISEFCKSQNINTISILKLDIEGFELKALQGCEMMLKEEKIDFVFAEVNLIPTYGGQPMLEDIISYLRKLNYIPYNFYGNNETNLRESIITNILFMSNRVAKEIVAKKGSNAVYVNQ